MPVSENAYVSILSQNEAYWLYLMCGVITASITIWLFQDPVVKLSQMMRQVVQVTASQGGVAWNKSVSLGQRAEKQPDVPVIY